MEVTSDTSQSKSRLSFLLSSSSGHSAQTSSGCSGAPGPPPCSEDPLRSAPMEGIRRGSLLVIDTNKEEVLKPVDD